MTDTNPVFPFSVLAAKKPELFLQKMCKHIYTLQFFIQVAHFGEAHLPSIHV